MALHEADRKPCFVTGESSYFSGLYVDGDKLLAPVAPNVTAETLEPACACCTHTFNGTPFTRSFPRAGWLTLNARESG